MATGCATTVDFQYGAYCDGAVIDFSRDRSCDVERQFSDFRGTASSLTTNTWTRSIRDTLSDRSVIEFSRMEERSQRLPTRRTWYSRLAAAASERTARRASSEFLRLESPDCRSRFPKSSLRHATRRWGRQNWVWCVTTPRPAGQLGSGGGSTALTHNNDTYVMGIGPFRSGSVFDQRQQAVGFNGVGGSFMRNPMKVARGRPVKMVDASIDDPYNAVPQIATLPSESLVEIAAATASRRFQTQ